MALENVHAVNYPALVETKCPFHGKGQDPETAFLLQLGLSLVKARVYM